MKLRDSNLSIKERNPEKLRGVAGPSKSVECVAKKSGQAVQRQSAGFKARERFLGQA